MKLIPLVALTGGVARSTNPQSPQYFTGGQQPITPNFPVSPGTGGGPMRQTSEVGDTQRFVAEIKLDYALPLGEYLRRVMLRVVVHQLAAYS